MQTKHDLSWLDEYVSKAMEKWNVPALSLVAVANGEIDYVKGYGVKSADKPADKVDENTVFQIGSVTKSFTAAALMLLVQDGKLSLEDRVSKFLPWFRLYDPYASQQMTVRDLLAHRSGLDRGDFLSIFNQSMSRRQLIERLEHFQPAFSFRARFGYQNLMYVAAGEIVKAVTGVSWDDFVKQRIFTPLGMDSSTTTYEDLINATNAAKPHVIVDGKPVVIPYYRCNNIGPAGSIASSAREMANWLKLHLGANVWSGNEILKASSLVELHEPNTVIAVDPAQREFKEIVNPYNNFSAYALGWEVKDYRGKKFVSHGGAIDGMFAYACFVPELKVGVAVLTSGEAPILPNAVAMQIIDHYFMGASDIDWSERFFSFMEKMKELAAKNGPAKEPVKDAPASMPLERYTGTYEHPFYGQVVVKLVDTQLSASYGDFEGELVHFHFDTFKARWKLAKVMETNATFTFDATPKPDSLNLDFAVFKRKVSKPQ